MRFFRGLLRTGLNRDLAAFASLLFDRHRDFENPFVIRGARLVGPGAVRSDQYRLHRSLQERLLRSRHASPQMRWAARIPRRSGHRGGPRFVSSDDRLGIRRNIWGRVRWKLRIALLSDTHGFLDDAVFRHFAECDEIWHAGDFGTVEILDRLKTFRPVRGVYGNVDGAELRADLHKDLVWECAGLNVYMTHIGGYPGNYNRRAGKEIQRLRPGLFICGHISGQSPVALAA